MSENSLENIKKNLQLINPLQRMINSEGLNNTFDILKKNNPNLIIHEFNSGDRVEDWEVPQSWEVKTGQMIDKDGKIIASIEENILFVAPYSEPIKGWFSKDEIKKHLMTREDRPNDFLLEHRNAYDYNLKSWGITLPFNLWKNLPNEKYFIEIDVSWKKNSMKVGEVFIKGKTSEIICLTAHIDELCNDDLVSCIVALEFFNELIKIKDLKYSYQLLLFPELFGPIFYLNRFKKLIDNYKGMLNLETVGSGENLCLKQSINGNSDLDYIMKLTLKNLQLKFKELDFFAGYLNDEKIFSWPSLGIDSIAIQRYPFNEYHTSSDTIDIINYKYLSEILEILKKFTFVLENDYIPEYVNFFPPWLTKRGLYIDKIDRPDLDKNKFNNQLLYSINGKNKLSEICYKHNLDFTEVYNYLDSFIEKDLLKKS